MKPNRVLNADMLALQLKAYGSAIGEAVNDPKHRIRVKATLEAFDHHDEFYTETDLRSQSITWIYGIHKWLGYDKPDPNPFIEHLPIDYVAELVHPVLRDWYRVYVTAASLVFCENKTNYLKSRFSITMPVKKANGEYVLIKQLSMPFGKDANGKLVSLINSYTVFGTFNGEPLKLEWFDEHRKMNGELITQFEQLVTSSFRFKKVRNLTKDQFSIVGIIEELKKTGEEVNTNNISKRFKSNKTDHIEKDAIAKALNRMKSRLLWLLQLDQPITYGNGDYKKEYLPKHETAIQLIDYFYNSGMLNLLRSYAPRQ